MGDILRQTYQPKSNSFIGQPIERVEDLRFLRGRGTYVADVEVQNELHAVIFRSPVAHGRITHLDVGAAASLPGVAAVITCKDIGEVPIIPLRQQVFDEGIPYLQSVIAVDKVRYVGEPVAVVLAETAAIAEDALELIEFDVEELPVVVTTQAAATDRQLLFEESGTNCPIVMTASKGDAEKAFASAPYTRRESFSVQRHFALPMETRGLLAVWDEAEEQLTVHGATKVIFFNRALLAKMLGLSNDRVEMIEVDVGGAFGARGEFYPEDFLIPFAARHTGRPVRWIEDRRENLMAMNHAREMDAEIEIACELDGTVIGLRGNINVDIGAYVRTNGFTAPRNVAQFCSGPYDIANIALDASVFMTNKTPAGTYRGPGRFEASFFMERLLHLAAQDLGIDQAEIRRKNLIPEAKMPFKMARMAHVDPSSETECDGGAYGEVFDRCLEEFGWEEKQHLQGKLIDGRYHGIGLGCFVEGGAAGPREGVRMRLESDGSVIVNVGSSAVGQGLQTILGQIAADGLGLPMERISVRHGSTSLVKEGFGSFHSRSTVMGGSAVHNACIEMMQRIREKAALRFGCSAEAIEILDGKARHKGASLDFAALAGEGLEVELSFPNSKHTYSYGAHAAHVAVDPATGHVEILKYQTVEDVGRVINPATLHGQVLGSACQGFGSVFLEEIIYDENGQLLTGTLADYLIPTSTDFRGVDSVSLGLRPCPNNPLGAKGAGEGGLIAVGGTLANAIAAALSSFDVKPHHLPLTPRRIWHLINDSKKSGFAAQAQANSTDARTGQ